MVYIGIHWYVYVRHCDPTVYGIKPWVRALICVLRVLTFVRICAESGEREMGTIRTFDSFELREGASVKAFRDLALQR